MLRLLRFSDENDEYVVLTEELEVDADEWQTPGYKLSTDFRFTPDTLSSWHSLPLNYELHRQD